MACNPRYKWHKLGQSTANPLGLWTTDPKWDDFPAPLLHVILDSAIPYQNLSTPICRERMSKTQYLTRASLKRLMIPPFLSVTAKHEATKPTTRLWHWHVVTTHLGTKLPRCSSNCNSKKSFLRKTETVTHPSLAIHGQTLPESNLRTPQIYINLWGLDMFGGAFKRNLI